MYERRKMPGQWLFKVVPIFIAFVFILIITMWILGGVLVYKTAGAVEKDGVRGVIEKVWCGEQPNCRLPF